MKKGGKPIGKSGKDSDNGDPYGSLINNPISDQINPVYHQMFGNGAQWDTKDFQASVGGRSYGLYDQPFDYGLDRGRWRRAYARAINLSPNAPSFDIYVDGRLFYGGLAYRMQTDYTGVRPGNHRILVYAPGQTKNPVFYKTVYVPRRSIVSFVICGRVANLDVMVVDDKTAIPPGRVRVKVVHLAANTPAIDLMADRSLWFNQIMYQEESEYMTCTAGRESLSVRLSGTRQTVLTLPSVQFVRNRTYTVYAIGLLNDSPPLQLLVVPDGSGSLQLD